MEEKEKLKEMSIADVNALRHYAKDCLEIYSNTSKWVSIIHYTEKELDERINDIFPYLY